MSVLILGATSPIARALANLYASQGRAVFLAARDVSEADRLAADLKIRHGVLSGAAAFDATDFDSHAGLVAAAEKAVGELSVAIVAFGAMGDQAYSERDFEAAKFVIDTNYTGAASISEAVASRMESRGEGVIIGITSVAGDRGRASNYFYGSAKGAYGLYLGGLRNRLFPKGVHVMNVKLGFVDTRMTYGMKTGIPVASPESVARAIEKASKLGLNEFYYPTFWAGIMGIIKNIPEGIFKRLSL